MGLGLGGINVKEGIFNPKTTGTDFRVTQGLSEVGQQYGQGAVEAQRAALAGYQGLANGTGTSLAQLQLKQGMQQQQQAATGLMGQSRGGNLAATYGQTLGAQSGAMADYNQQAAMLRAQEQQMAYQNMAGLGGQMAGQQFGYDQLNQQSQLGLRGQDLDYNLGKRGLDLQGQQQRFGQNLTYLKMGAGALSAALKAAGSMSDVRAKEDMHKVSVADAVSPLQDAAGSIAGIAPDEAAAEVGGLAYKYKPGMGLPPGQQFGVSAQQLAGTSLGPTLVNKGPDGMLRVDGGRAGIAALAASGENTRRLRMMEQRLAEQTGQGNLAQRFGTRDEGMANTSQARTLSEDITAERERALMAREQMAIAQGRYGDQHGFAGAPQMYRGASSPDPFAQGPNDSRGYGGLAGIRTRYFPELAGH